MSPPCLAHSPHTTSETPSREWDQSRRYQLGRPQDARLSPQMSRRLPPCGPTLTANPDGRRRLGGKPPASLASGLARLRPRPWRDGRLAAPRPLWRASVEPTQLLHLRAFSAAALSAAAFFAAAFSAAAFSAPAFSAPAFSAAAFTSAWRRDTSVWVRVRVRVRVRARVRVEVKVRV